MSHCMSVPRVIYVLVTADAETIADSNDSGLICAGSTCIRIYLFFSINVQSVIHFPRDHSLGINQLQIENCFLSTAGNQSDPGLASSPPVRPQRPCSGSQGSWAVEEARLRLRLRPGSGNEEASGRPTPLKGPKARKAGVCPRDLSQLLPRD